MHMLLQSSEFGTVTFYFSNHKLCLKKMKKQTSTNYFHNSNNSNSNSNNNKEKDCSPAGINFFFFFFAFAFKAGSLEPETVHKIVACSLSNRAKLPRNPEEGSGAILGSPYEAAYVI